MKLEHATCQGGSISPRPLLLGEITKFRTNYYIKIPSIKSTVEANTLQYKCDHPRWNHCTIHCTPQHCTCNHCTIHFTFYNPLHVTITLHNSVFTITRGLRGEKRPLRSVSHTLPGAFAQIAGCIRVPGPRAERAALGCVWGLGRAASETSEVGKRQAALGFVGGYI